MKKSKKVLILVVVLAVLAGGWLVVKGKQKPPQAQAVDAHIVVTTQKAQRVGELKKGIEASSNMEALDDVIVTPKVTGKLLSISVKKGDKVRKGQVLAVLDHKDQDAQVAAMQAQISVNRADVEQAKANLDSAQREYDRYTRLLKEGYATQQEKDARQTSLDTAKAAYLRASSTVNQASANLRAQQVNRTEYTLTSPINGTVLEDFDMTQGALVNTASSVVRIANTDIIKAVLNIPEGQAAQISEGMTATAKGEGFIFIGEQKEVTGKVSNISPYVDNSTRTVKVEVKIDNKSAGYPIKPGMFAMVFIVTDIAKNAIIVPKEAVLEGNKVWVVEGDKAKGVAVKTGIEQNGSIQITQGITSGDAVVIRGGNTLGDGDIVAQ